jgi:hypothetical protein
MKRRIPLFGVLLLTLTTPEAQAHHSFSMFDQAVLRKLNGTVQKLEWVNPHTWVHVSAVDEAGKPITWSFEAGSVAQLIAQGWKQDSLRAGDRIEIGFHPLKDGSYGGQVLAVRRPDGEWLCQGRGRPLLGRAPLNYPPCFTGGN